MPQRNPLATVSIYRLAMSTIACLTLLAIATCGKDSPTRTTPTPQPPTPQPPTPQPPTPPEPARITITPSSVNLTAIGQTIRLSATVYDNTNARIPEAEVSWTSSDSTVATVSTQGLVKAVNNGIAQISARSGNISNSINATVSQIPTSIAIEPMTVLMRTGETVQLQATVLDSSHHPVAAATVSWRSSDTKVVTVSAQGLVTAVSNGTANITARSGNASQTAVITVGSPVSSDRNALIALYHSTDGPNWTNSTNWLSDRPLNTWYGVSTNNLGEVRSLILRENNLQGDIPADIGQLQELTVLNLSNNQLTGGIPTNIGQLKDLTILGLDNNQLTGSIPNDIGLLQELTFLNLGNNRLTGSIPTEIGLLMKLTVLGLLNNQLTGSIPADIGLLQDLTYLGLGNNRLTGNIPSEIGLLKKLTTLNLGDNSDLVGPLPESFTMLADLKTLHLQNTKICIPQTVQFQSWVEEIPFRSGVNLCPGPQKDILIAFYHSTNGPNWTNSTNWLSDLPLSTWHGVSTNNLGEVRSLILRENNLQGDIPADIGQLQELTVLNLSNNQLTGSIPNDIGQLQDIRSLYLGHNQLTGDVPNEIGQLRKLNDLRLDNNRLTGNIPSEIGQLQDIGNLNFGHNQLTGDIPPEIGLLPDVSWLNLSNNRLTGSIPSEIGQLQEIGSLYLGNNQFTGDIPSEIGQLRKLNDLRLGNNRLTGNIPSEIGRLRNLKHLILGDNPGLAGPLPEALIVLANLETLYLHNSQICIPPETQYVAWFEGIPHRSGGQYCPNPERDALVALYDRTNGPNWTSSTNWKSLEPLDRWSGVNVDGEGQVTGLELENNNLNGTIPGQLSDLSHLKVLNLSNNVGLTGTIPVSVSRLDLEELELDGTQVCAPPDAGFQQWLVDIPQRAVTNCTDMRPDYYVLARLYHSTNGKNWTNSTNWLSDAPLNTWYGVRTNSSEEVTRLDLRENNLVGSIPTEIGRLKNLMQLNLGLNQLTGIVPSEISGLENITHLYLHSNELTGNIPSEIGQLKNLREFRLDQNRISGRIPPEIGDLQNLRDLRLFGNLLTGPIPPEIGRLHELTNLVLFNNRLTGDIPAEIWQLRNLRALVLRGDTYLRDRGNQLTGVIPPEIAQLVNLVDLELEFNRLTGNIPPEIGNLQELRDLRLSGNQLTGDIPSEIGRLQNLTDLVLFDNRLTGNVPSEIGQLLNLRFLDLSGNELDGAIPAEIGNLKSLRQLSLNDNQLSGTLPSEFAGLGMLQVLRLSTNRLSGRIPNSFGDLSNLRLLGLTNNPDMSGTLPLSLIRLNLDDLLLDGTMLCAPRTGVFQDWLLGVPNNRVSHCGTNTVRSFAYLTQAVQSLEHPVPLLAGEDALLRVFVTSDTDTDDPMPLVRATFYEGGAEVHDVDIQSQETPIPTEVDEGDLSSSANALIPGSVISPGLEMVIEIDPEGLLGPASNIEGRLPAEGRTAIDVREVPPFDLTMVPLLWTRNPDRSILARVEGLTADSDLFRLTRDVLPVNEFHVTIRDPVWTSLEPTFQNSIRLVGEIAVIRTMDGAGGYYMGILSGDGGGRAYRPGTVGVSTLNDPVIAHELGHNLGLGHAPCRGGGLGLDPDYPYSDGFIGVWGFDLLNGTLVHPGTWDIMSCGPPDWISDYFFNKSLGYRLHDESETLHAAAFEPSGRSLLLWGIVDSYGELVLEPSFVVDAPTALPELDGPYLLTGQDDGGGTLFNLRFGTAEIADGDGGGAFAFIIPARAAWSNRLTHITLSGPEGVAAQGGDAELNDRDAPGAALLLDTVTGNVRGILRDWPEAETTAVSARRVLPEPGLDVVISSGVPDAADWDR